MFHFNCSRKYASTRRICHECRTALPDSTYEFLCTIFVPEGIESIDPNTGEKEVMEAQVDEDELRHPTPDIRPLVAGLDADDFNMEKLLGTKVPKTPDDVGPDFEESLSEHARLKLKSDLLAIVDGPPRVTRSTRTRLEYEPIVVSASSPTKHVLVEVNSDTLGLSSPPIPICSPAIIPSPSPSIPIDLTNAGLDDPFSPPRSQIVPVDTFVDLAQYISSPENKRSKDQGWPSKCDLTKKDLQSGMLPGKHLRRDVINMYIKERVMFPLGYSFQFMGAIIGHALAIIRLHREYCHIVHLDSCVEIHTPTAIFHVLKTFISLTMKIDVTKIEHRSWPVDQQKDNFSCGIHVLQMLAGAGMREADLDRCFWQESLNSIATTDQVSSFWVMLGLYLEGKLKAPPT
ncbi:hypothetical protein R1sor_015813 [Riccia sorocarpa]|uniref:Ubiquitin-like protease family profile domain-containing protein n=1 Tax=Riccia sorocarpa TaxID=122646 RepID=A0ABD3HGC6_9MARC